MNKRILLLVVGIFIAMIAGYIVQQYVTGKEEKASTGEKIPTVVIEGAGASFQYPQIAQWVILFKEKTGIGVHYQSVGSGAGQKMFLVDKIVHFAASDPPLSKSQWETYRGSVLQIPWLMGAVAVVYNIPDIEKLCRDKPLNLTGEVLAKVYLGEIVHWDDPAIAKLNPTLADKLPRKEIIAVHRSDSSGTTEIFTVFLHKSTSERWPRNLVGKLIDWPVDKTGRGVGAKGNEGVTAVVRQTPYSIGYVELSYALETGLCYAAIENKAGYFVLPNNQTIQSAVKGITLPRSPLDDFSHVFEEVIYSPNKDAYPLSTLVFAFFWSKYNDPDVARAIVLFLRWIAQEGYNYMVKGYIKPPEEVISLILEAARMIEKNSLG